MNTILKKQILMGVFLFVFWTTPSIAKKTIETQYGTVLIVTFKEYTNPLVNNVCHELPKTIGYKAFQSQENHNFTAQEYEQLAGRSSYLGIRGYNNWYSKEKRKHVGPEELFKDYGSFNSGRWDNLPILCGISKNQLAQTQEKSVKAERSKSKAYLIQKWAEGNDLCEGAFCDLSGGTFFNAIYNNDIEMIDKIESSVDSFLHGSHKKRSAAYAILFSNKKRERRHFSLLRSVAELYLRQYQRNFAFSCTDDLVKMNFTHVNDTYDVWNSQGIYDSQGGGEVTRFSYVIDASLESLCEQECDALGGQDLGEKAFLSSIHKGVDNTFKSVTKQINKYACDSPEIKQFEKNLSSLVRKKYGNRPLPKNTTFTRSNKKQSKSYALYKSCKSIPHIGNKFCKCIAENSDEILTSTELDAFGENFQLFFDKIRKLDGLSRPPASDRVWQLNKLKSQCN